MHHSLVFGGCNYIVYFEDHLDDLGGELKLVTLGGGGLEDALLVHIGCALAQSIDSDEWVLLVDLLLLDLAHILDRRVAGVLGESQRDLFEGVCESADGILLNTFDLVGFLLNGN